MEDSGMQFGEQMSSMETMSREPSQILNSTWSICPVCMQRLPAERVKKGSEIFLEKTCSEHGFFSTLIWRGHDDFNEWIGSADEGDLGLTACPGACGLCSDHLQKTCCTVLNITSRCNLDCRFCFASSGGGSPDPGLDEIREIIIRLVEKDKTLLQLSGGEPTLRDDLPMIIKIAKEAGAKYVQLNTNGIRLGEEAAYAGQLKKAGLSFVFMQFDGTDDEIYRKLRGRELFGIKRKAIENCSSVGLGVTLAPTLVRDVNMHNIGGIIRFALSHSPAVRGIHFQPATFTGRAPGIPSNNDRITLDELVWEICKQSNGLIKADDLLPSACDHPLCGFHGDFIASGGKLIPLLKRGETGKQDCCSPPSDHKEKATQCCSPVSAAEKNREFIARRWLRPGVKGIHGASVKDSEPGENSAAGNSAPDNADPGNAGEADIRDMSVFLDRVKSHGFTITAMAFQDAGNLDFSRLRHCSFHVYEKGNFIPFCSYYLKGWKQ